MRISDWSSDVCSSDLQAKVVGNRGRERAKDDPDHEGEIEIEKGSDEGRPVAARPEARFGRRSPRGCSRHRPSPCVTGNKKAARTAAMRAHPDGFIACWDIGEWLPVCLRFVPPVGTGAALSQLGRASCGEWVCQSV